MSTRNHRVHALVLGAGLLLSACLPSNLDKYRSKEGQDKNSPSSAGEDPFLSPSHDPTPGPMPEPSRGRVSTRSQPKEPAAPRATIYAVDKQTFRFALKENEVWDTALDVLLKNYNLVIVDRQSGIITTEWDSYFLASAVYRNKVSLRLRKNGYNSLDLTVHNSVERLRDAAQAAGTVGAVWLPAEDPANEVSRIVQNMALMLNQPPPVLPPSGAVAKSGNQGSPSPEKY